MLLEYLVGFAIAVISAGGYIGVFILMALESMIAPVPSEVVMPFAGFLVAGAKFSAIGVIIAAALGSIAGSLASYYVGLYGGREAVLKYGRYLLLDKKHLEWTEKWFASQGEKTIFISRFIPVVRHLISIPAGVGRMNKGKFLVYTLVGASIWNTFLLYVGIRLSESWQIVGNYSEKLDIAVGVVLAVSVVLFLIRAKK